MVRRVLLAVVLILVALALINGAVVRQVPRWWVPDVLVNVQHYINAEGAMLGAVFGLGLVVVAFNPLANRMWVVLAILYGALNVALQVDHYYRGRTDVLPSIVFWVAVTALMLALFPTRPRAFVPAPRPLTPTSSPLQRRS